MPAILVTALALAKDEHEDRRARRELADEGYQLEYGPLVFSEEDGEPWWPSRFEWVWQEFRKSSRLASRFHDLRHTALSLMLRQGHSPKVVQEIAGHHSSAYTMDADSAHLGHRFRRKPITDSGEGDHSRSEATHVLVSSTRVIGFRSISWHVSGLLGAWSLLSARS